MSEEDTFVLFVDSARRMLCESCKEGPNEGPCDTGNGWSGGNSQMVGPSWSWVCSRILACCKSYSSGVTLAILLTDLSEAWLERDGVEKCWKGRSLRDPSTYSMYRKHKQKQFHLRKILTVDSINEKRFVSLDAVMDVVILDIKLLPGTSSYLLTLGDAWSVSTIDLYLHRKFYDLINSEPGILGKGREIILTGCQVRNAFSSGVFQSRLLPTEKMLILLDEEQEDDLVLLGAKFCSDTFSCIEYSSVKSGVEYCFYARVEQIGEIGTHEQQKHVKQQKIRLCDDNGDTRLLVFWNDQISLGSLFSEGSMIAIERPLIAYDLGVDSAGSFGFWLEYGLETRLYAVPYVPAAQQVTVEDIPYHKSVGLAHGEECENFPKSQVALPRDSQGSVNFNNFPLRLLVRNLSAKMSGVALYGVVSFLASLHDSRPSRAQESASSNSAFRLKLQDYTGVVDINLYFNENWSAGEIHAGQIVFISGLITSVALDGRLECTWKEKDQGASLVNITQLPALLSSSCLHTVTPLSCDMSSKFTVQVCWARISKVEHHEVHVRLSHVFCGHPVILQPVPGVWRCTFCGTCCDVSETVPVFFVTALFEDAQPGNNTLVRASCSGRAAAEILQASPEDFISWPEIDQGMYLFSLEKEEFLLALYEDDHSTEEINGAAKELSDIVSLKCLKIGQALKKEQNHR